MIELNINRTERTEKLHKIVSNFLHFKRALFVELAVPYKFTFHI